MAKYQVNFYCGHTETVQLFGKTAERERWIEWAEQNKLCRDCYEKQKGEVRQEAARAAAEEAVENGLPSLVGSDKQIAWAETIRAEKLAEVDRLIAPLDSNMAKVAADPALLEKANRKAVEDGFIDFADSGECLKEAVNCVKEIDSAKWWIDNRTENMRNILAETAKQVAKVRKDTIPVAVDAKAEATIRPENPVTETVAEIRIHEKSVEVVFPEKREDFWLIIKKHLGFAWTEGSWKRPAGIKTGTPVDRAAETGNRLLAAGFCVRIFDPAIREAAVNGTFEPEADRWVMQRTSGAYSGWFAIDWKERNENLYNAARKLKGSKYDQKAVVVPPEQFEEVLDFAGLYGFRLSPGAHEVVERARSLRSAALTATPVKSEAIHHPPVPESKPEKLAVPESVEVADEFKD